MAGVYSIKCDSCPSLYFGESIDIDRRIYQHRYDLRTDNLNSALVKHRSRFNHVVSAKTFEIIRKCNNNFKRKLLESYLIYISKNQHINVLEGEMRLDAVLCNILKSDKKWLLFADNK